MPMNTRCCWCCHSVFSALRAVAMCLVTGTAAVAAPVCTTNATPLVFGSYNGLSASTTQISSSVQVSCVIALAPLATVPYTISLSTSQTTGTMSRAMAGPSGARLQYNLYTSAAYSTVWGNGSGGTQTVSDSVTPTSLAAAATKNHTVHGQIPGLQSVRVGAYADGIIVTVDY